MLDVLLDSLLDSLRIALVVLLFNILLSFFSIKINKAFSKNKKLQPLYGSLFGIIPECGISVCGTELYINGNITTGTIIAIFLSCSDEAIPLLIGGLGKRFYYVFILILFKILIGFLVGFIYDLIKKEDVKEFLISEKYDNASICSVYHKNSKVDKYIIHPLIHTLKLFIYVFIINFIFGILMFYFENNITNFLLNSKYLSPIFTSVIGLVPSCASSVIITELFINGKIGFGALLSGLMVNAGLGFMILLKNKEKRKNGFYILLICFVVSILFGYLSGLIFGF